MLDRICLIINLYLINQDDEEKTYRLRGACNWINCLHYKTRFCTDSTLWHGSLKININSAIFVRHTVHMRTDQPIYIISYPLFADADTGIYPHAALQYHSRPKAKRGIAMLSVDKFPYPRKQTRGNEFIPYSNNICDILKRFRSFKIPAITLIWPKSAYKHSVTRSYRSGKESGRRCRNRHCDVINDVPLSLYLTLMTFAHVRYGSIFHGC